MADLESKEPLNIVLVDDDLNVLYVHSAYIRMLGHRVWAFTTPEAVFEFMFGHKGSVDLVITDYRMPSVSGSELIHRIRSLGFEVPSIILTGHAHEITGLDYTKYRTSIVGKPVKIAELNHQIKSQVSNHVFV